MSIESYSKVIRIDGEVYRLLKYEAIRFGMQFSSPNKVLRVLLGLDSSNKEYARSIDIDDIEVLGSIVIRIDTEVYSLLSEEARSSGDQFSRQRPGGGTTTPNKVLRGLLGLEY